MMLKNEISNTSELNISIFTKNNMLKKTPDAGKITYRIFVDKAIFDFIIKPIVISSDVNRELSISYYFLS